MIIDTAVYVVLGIIFILVAACLCAFLIFFFLMFSSISIEEYKRLKKTIKQ